MVRRAQIHGIALLLAAAATAACGGGKDNKCAVLAVPDGAGACYLADGRVALPDGGILEADEVSAAGLPTLEEARDGAQASTTEPVATADAAAASAETTPPSDADGAVDDGTAAEAPLATAETSAVDSGDAGEPSAVAVDAAPPPECTQAAECTAKKPLCKAGECVACAADTDCMRFADTPHCGLSGACVACAADQHCLDPQKPVCGASHVCEHGCTSDTQCSRSGVASWSTPLCATDLGSCVQCTPGPGELTQCTNGLACDLKQRMCSGRPRGSVGLCGECSASTECGSETVCAPTMFKLQSAGNQCVLLYTTPEFCPVGLTRAMALTTVDGTGATVCYPLATSSCQAARDFGKQCTSHADCGIAGEEDGPCVPSQYQPDFSKCSVPCRADADCGYGGTCTPRGYCAL
jgi:hypothetical protein